METQLLRQPVHEIETDALIVLGFEADAPRNFEPLAGLNQSTGGWIEETYRSGEFAGKTFDISMLHRPSGLKARRLILAGCGKAAAFGSADLRRVAGAAIRQLKPKSFNS